MSSRRKPPPDSLAALAESGAPIYIQCERCKHYRRLEPYKVATRLGWGATIKEIEHRHRCTRCGSRRAQVRRG